MKILKLTETTSTNDVLLAHPAPSPKEMVVAVAEYQTAGRGQAGNSWESERGKNLLFSILTCPQNIAVTDQYVLSMAGALALKAALDRYTDHITLKWPNDIYWRDRKISGTLIETTVKGKRIERCVYGIGLNVNQHEFRSNAPNPVSLYNIIGVETPITLKWPNDIYWRDRKISGTLIETTVKGKRIERCVYGIGLNVNQHEFRSNAPNPVSLYNIIGVETPLKEVLDAVLLSFNEYYQRAIEGDISGIIHEYNAALFRREGLHPYEDCATHERFEARISHVAPNGCLHLIDANGQERTYWMKEVRFIL